MESWSYVSGNKSYVSDDFVSERDEIGRIKNGRSIWGGLKPSALLSSDQDGTQKNQELDESGSSDVMKNSLANASITDVLSGKFSFGRFPIQFPETLSCSASGEEDSCSKPSSSINSRDSSLIDLKLGRFPDQKQAGPKANVKFSQSEPSSMPAKRTRAASLSSQRAFCQVHGCRKDLSSSKDYHKRHKVCEIHSKTTKVIVNGIEQRFCQQCSRFHLLAEFDDGKRSCRKRLAGHNERRRKPHISMHTGRAGRMFHPYTGIGLDQSSYSMMQHSYPYFCYASAAAGGRFEGRTSSFVCQDILPGGGGLLPQKYGMKVEDGSDYGPATATPNSKGERHVRSPFCDDDGLHAMTRTRMNQQKYNQPLMQSVSNSDFHFHHPVFHEDLTVLESSSSSAAAKSGYGCALSLLSSQSHNSSIHSSGLPACVHPLITPTSSAHYSITQVSEKLTRVSPQTSATGMPSLFRSSAQTQMEPILISDGSDSVNYGISGIIPGSEFPASTIDLLQLSSQLQRVEHERQSMKAKEDSDAFFGLRIT